MNANPPSIIVRVLMRQGPVDLADHDVVPHLMNIRDRYQELKRITDFQTAHRQSAIDWLEGYMIEAYPPDNHERQDF